MLRSTPEVWRRAAAQQGTAGVAGAVEGRPAGGALQPARDVIAFEVERGADHGAPEAVGGLQVGAQLDQQTDGFDLHAGGLPRRGEGAAGGESMEQFRKSTIGIEVGVWRRSAAGRGREGDTGAAGTFEAKDGEEGIIGGALV